MSYTRKQGIEDSQFAIDSYREQLEELRQEAEAFAAAVKDVEEQKLRVRGNLSTSLVPEINTDKLAELNVLGFGHLPDLIQQQADKRTECQSFAEQCTSEGFETEFDRQLNPEVGELTRQLQEVGQLHDGLSSQLADYPEQDIQLIEEVGQPNKGIFTKLLQAVTFKAGRADKARARIAVAVGVPADAVLDEYYRLRDQLKDIGQLLDDCRQSEEQLRAKKQRLQDARHFDNNYEQELLKTVRLDLAANIAALETDYLRDNFPEGCRLYVGQLHALEQKAKYLTNAMEGVQQQVTDRQQRIEKIEQVQSKWKRSSRHQLSGDKSNWLVNVPKMKQQSTRRYTSKCGGVRDSIVSYEHYDDYSNHYYAAGQSGTAAAVVGCMLLAAVPVAVLASVIEDIDPEMMAENFEALEALDVAEEAFDPEDVAASEAEMS